MRAWIHHHARGQSSTHSTYYAAACGRRMAKGDVTHRSVRTVSTLHAMYAQWVVVYAASYGVSANIAARVRRVIH